MASCSIGIVLCIVPCNVLVLALYLCSIRFDPYYTGVEGVTFAAIILRVGVSLYEASPELNAGRGYSSGVCAAKRTSFVLGSTSTRFGPPLMKFFPLSWYLCCRKR